MPSSEPHPDLLLARQAAAGQRQAWSRLIELYGTKIYNLAFQFAGHRGEAEELCQEIFLKLFLNLERYSGEVPLVAWALRLSRNLCIDHYRRHRRERRATFVSAEILEAFPAEGDPDRDMLRRQRLHLIYQTLEGMPEELATAIVLRDLQGLSYDEAAAALGLPLGTFKSRVHRARRELDRRLRAVEEGEPATAGDRTASGAQVVAASC